MLAMGAHYLDFIQNVVIIEKVFLPEAVFTVLASLVFQLYVQVFFSAIPA